MFTRQRQLVKYFLLKINTTSMNSGNGVTNKSHISHIYVMKTDLKGSHHGTIMRTGIACKKIPCYMHDSACRWRYVKNVKIF